MSVATIEDFLNYDLFVQEFNNAHNGVKKSFNREELLSVQLLHYLREVYANSPLKKIDCSFDTKSHIIARWNEMVENIESIESAPVLTLIFNPILNFIFDENKNEIAAFEQFLSIIQSGVVDYKMATFEYSDQSKLFVGFCLNNWKPELMTYDFTYDKYKGVNFSFVEL